VKRLVVTILIALAAPAVAEGRVDVMVVGKHAVLAGPQRVAMAARTARVGGKRCALGRRTPLSVLAGTRVSFRLKDYGSCSRKPRDSGSLYVRRIGPDRESGRDGWVYKVGNRAGSTGAADPAGPFGDGRKLRTGQRVLWFWCVKDAADSCQRTLAVAPERTTTTAGAPLRVTVRGYDDNGSGARVAGATVRLGAVSAVSGAHGVATLTAPAAGRYPLRAEKPGMVDSFPVEIEVT
jgi:hypothetical protein